MYDRKRTGVDERSIKSKRLMNYGGKKTEAIKWCRRPKGAK